MSNLNALLIDAISAGNVNEVTKLLGEGADPKVGLEQSDVSDEIKAMLNKAVEDKTQQADNNIQTPQDGFGHVDNSLHKEPESTDDTL